MSIKKGSTNISSIYKGNSKFVEIYKGTTLVYMTYSNASNYIFRELNSSGKLTKASGSLSTMTNIRNIKPYGLYQAFTDCPNLTGTVSFPNLININKDYAFAKMFKNCTGITAISFPNLTIINGIHSAEYMFQGCTSLTSISFPKLTIVNQDKYAGMYNMFQGCTSLTSISFPNLTTVLDDGMKNCFTQCSALTTVSFPKLTNLKDSQSLQYCFTQCSALKSLSFPALTTTSFGTYTNQFSGLVSGTTGVNIHFPSNLQSKISSLTGYPLFGGTDTILTFDLPETS